MAYWVSSAVLRIVGDPDLAARMGQASLTVGQAHSETHTFDAYEELYRRIAQPGIHDLV